MQRLLTALQGPGSGVRAWSIYHSVSRRLSVGTKDRETGNAHAPLSLVEATGASYRFVWDDGTISRGALDHCQLDAAPESILAFARLAAYRDDDAARIVEPMAIPDVELHDPAAAKIARGSTELLEQRLADVRRLVEDGGFSTWSGSFSAGEARVRLCSSTGIDISGEGTSTGWFVSLDGEMGTGFGARKPEVETEFRSRLDRLVGMARELAREGKPDDGGVRPVILHPKVVEEYVLETLVHHLEGGTIDHGDGLFSKDDFGSDRPMLREDLSLRLDPLLPLRSGSYRFSGEGVPAGRCHFVDRGRLTQPVLDVKYANRLGLSPTPIPYSMDTLFLEGPEPLELEAALDGAAGGALVLSVLGVHTQDSSSGDFSLSAPQSLAIDGGGFAGRLRPTISGNLFEVLRSDALRLVRFEGEHTPGLLFPCRLDSR